MAVLTDQNLRNYAKYLDQLAGAISSMNTELDKAETLLNKSTGATFRANYAKGKKATSNIQSIIDILQSLKKDLNTLVNDGKKFYETSLQASKK